VAIVQRLVALVGDRQAARWDRFGGPGPTLRWCFRHPWLVTIGVGALLAVALGSVFGVPPFSPLVLVVVLVAPIQPVLRAQQRVHERWMSDRGGASPAPSPDEPHEPDDAS
jgi:hypothetical protein